MAEPIAIMNALVWSNTLNSFACFTMVTASPPHSVEKMASGCAPITLLMWLEKSTVPNFAKLSPTNSTSGLILLSVARNIFQEVWPYS